MPLLSRRRVGDNKCAGLRAGAGIDRIGLEYDANPLHSAAWRVRGVYSSA